ncbi:unnamed protein product [Cyprideis torosa]|uniref:Small ribosomal subunit protein uS15m n=1 Tax=Cyprideis torosa TaxID=163714 RepID=A0A7R8ZP07_9CRUS|nr:unnamed protein product [Cyprideis torosa]CAG0892807.1 unnamed protein product [Cyprideis torosa]
MEGKERSFVAKLTAHIRRAQYDIFETSTGRFNYKRICIVRGQVQKRRRLLKELRFLDYRRFEWVLEQLNIRFQNYPAVTIRIDRRQALRRLFSEHRQRVHMERRKELHQKFLESQKEFLEEKIEKLKWIAEEEKELRLPSTVSEKDIEAAQERAKAYVPFELSPPPQWPGPGQWPYDTFFVRSDFVVKKTSRIFAHFQTLETYDVK